MLYYLRKLHKQTLSWLGSNLVHTMTNANINSQTWKHLHENISRISNELNGNKTYTFIRALIKHPNGLRRHTNWSESKLCVITALVPCWRDTKYADLLVIFVFNVTRSDIILDNICTLSGITFTEGRAWKFITVALASGAYTSWFTITFCQFNYTFRSGFFQALHRLIHTSLYKPSSFFNRG